MMNLNRTSRAARDASLPAILAGALLATGAAWADGGGGDVGDPTPQQLATGSNSGVDGFLSVLADGLGSQSQSFDGGPNWLDRYNPVGGNLANPGFTNTTFFYTNTQRASLSSHQDVLGIWGESGVEVEVLTDNVASDTDGDSVDDTAHCTFQLTDGANTDLHFGLTQSVESFVPTEGDPVATWTLEYLITNNAGVAKDFRFVRWCDYDITYQDPLEADVAGTATNGQPAMDRHVYMLENGSPNFGVTLSSPNGGTYVGSKSTVDPDGDGGDPPFGGGTELQVWDNFGLPGSWENHIANVGTNVDGESGPSPGGDGSMGLQVEVSLGAGESTTVTFMHTYGAVTPAGGGMPESCPWDLNGDNIVGTGDLILLLGSWGDPYGTADLIELLGNWGPCRK